MRGMENDVYFQVGLLTTIGLSAKNAILIVEFAKDLMDKEGKGLIESTLEAVRMRLRPNPDDITGLYPRGYAAGYQQRRRLWRSERGRYRRNGRDGDSYRLAIFFVPVFFVVVRRRFSKKD
ncbi:Acriflavine resistance protein B [Serratia fonticola]|uniref:Acriflavine resistance protein B n=1 Tax=Serratia fonticola TaxID=47917 RepID=A0A4U9VH63_SERFO|nr:Acriflavine resistance protein B [Serratia fonticola]